MKFKKSRIRNNAQALLWRMLLLHKKHWICTILTIVLPSLLFGILVVINSFAPGIKIVEEIEVKTFENEDLFGEIVKKLNTTNKPALILFTPENNLTRDLTNQINLSLNFLIEDVLNGESNFGNYFFKELHFSYHLQKMNEKNTRIRVFCVDNLFVRFLQLESKSKIFLTVINKKL